MMSKFAYSVSGFDSDACIDQRWAKHTADGGRGGEGGEILEQ